MASDLIRDVATPAGALRIRMREARPSRRGAEHERFLAAHWPELVAAAFEGYRRHGAGAVILWRDGAPRRFRPRPFRPERLYYSTQLHALPGATDDTFDGWEAEQIERYDPQTESVVVIVEGKQMAAYRIEGAMSPPDALQGSRSALN